jgi:hypothetical protein
MLTHVVLFQFADPAAAKTAADKLAAMDGRIETLRAIEVGLDVSKSARSFDVALITRFEDQAGLEAYAVHPVHLEVVAYIKAHAEKSIVVDYLA